MKLRVVAVVGLALACSGCRVQMERIDGVSPELHPERGHVTFEYNTRAAENFSLAEHATYHRIARHSLLTAGVTSIGLMLTQLMDEKKSSEKVTTDFLFFGGIAAASFISARIFEGLEIAATHRAREAGFILTWEL